MVGLGLFVHVGSLVAAGLGIVWSWLLVRAYPERRTRRGRVLRAVVVFVLVAPFAFNFLP